MSNVCVSDLEEKLKIIKKWLVTQQHLPQNLDDQFLRRFIVCSECNVEKTKSLIDLCFTMRSKAPELFDNRDPLHKDISDYLKHGDTVPLPKPTVNNYKLILVRCAKQPEYFIYANVLKTILMVADLRLAIDPEITAGEVPIFDMAHSSLYQLSRVSLPILKKYMAYTQEAHPVRLKQIHVINIPTFLDKVMMVVKPFMKSEVAAMLHFHPDMESFYKHVPRELLPEEYGGSVGKLQAIKQEWINKVHEHRNYFLDETRWKVDETKRAGIVRNEKTKLFKNPIPSFKALEID